MASPIPISLRGKPVELRDPKYFQELVSKWIPAKQVWPFTYGDESLIGFGAASAAYSCYYFRHNLRLGRQARLTMYGPAMAFTALTTIMYQQLYITGQVINPQACPLCVQLKSAIGQVLVGGVIPLLSTSIASMYFADRLLTHPVPPLLTAPQEVFAVWLKLMKANRTVFSIHAGIQIVAASYITYRKQLCFAELEETCFK